MATEKRRVLVFGASNEGKTSVINLLTGNNAPIGLTSPLSSS